MTESVLQTLNDIASYIADWSHPVANQIAIASVVTIGLIMCVLSAVFPLRRERWRIAPLVSDAQEGATSIGDGADHVALSKLCSGEEV